MLIVMKVYNIYLFKDSICGHIFGNNNLNLKKKKQRCASTMQVKLSEL